MKHLSFFNCSVTKVLDLEENPIDKARLKLIIHALIIGILYCVTLIPFHLLEKQPNQLIRSTVVLVILATTLKYLLYKPSWKFVSQIILITLSALVWTNIFIYARNIDILTIQFIIIIIISSFYVLGMFYGIFYALLNIFPFAFFFIFYNTPLFHLILSVEEIHRIPFSIAVSYNMLLIFFIHFHFFRVYNLYISELSNKKEKLEQTISDLEASKNLLYKHNEFNEKILSALAVDIKSPLRYLMLTAQRLHTARKEGGSDLYSIKESSSKLYRVTDTLLKYASLSLKDQHLEKISFSIFDLVEEKIKILEGTARVQNNVVTNKLIPGTSIFTNKETLDIVIFNILDNALKFTENNEITILSTKQEVDFSLTIIDKGRGMPEKLVSWCNDPQKSNLANAAIDDINEQGLGLIIAKELLLKINSRLVVVSKSSGTAVTIIIKEYQ